MPVRMRAKIKNCFSCTWDLCLRHWISRVIVLETLCFGLASKYGTSKLVFQVRKMLFAAYLFINLYMLSRWEASYIIFRVAALVSRVTNTFVDMIQVLHMVEVQNHRLIVIVKTLSPYSWLGKKFKQDSDQVHWLRRAEWSLRQLSFYFI